MKTIVSLLTRIFDTIARVETAAPLLLRLAVGIVFVGTGWGKLHNLDGVTDFFRSLGIPAPELQAPFIAGLEFVGGLALVVGLATRPFAALLSSTMVVAIATAKWAEVEGLQGFLTLEETHYLVMFVALVAFGAGKVSVDAVLRRAFAPATAPAAAAARS
ncbi:MAG: DoxX family protein [Myxococcaceae bacterium]|nr:DoxX family protein [Myxococcaceae bacterium]